MSLDDAWIAHVLLCPVDPSEQEPWRVKMTKGPAGQRISPRHEFFASKRKLGWPDAVIQDEWEARQAENRRRAAEQAERAKEKQAKAKPKRNRK